MKNLMRRGVEDNQKINTHDQIRLDQWGKRFGVTAVTLKMAAADVGPSIKAIREWLNLNCYIKAID